MWKFLPGVSKSESKRKVDTCESNKAYNATRRKKTFQPHWLQMYKWHVIIKKFQGGHAPNWPQTPLADLGRLATLTANTGLDINSH